jgi:hypothetical protein
VIEAVAENLPGDDADLIELPRRGDGDGDECSPRAGGRVRLACGGLHPRL